MKFLLNPILELREIRMVKMLILIGRTPTWYGEV